jgi:hypothetical protein
VNDLPRQKLREIIAQYGRSVCENPQHCKGLLLDLCGDYKREVNILIAALEEHVVDELLHISAGVPTELVLVRLTQRLCDHRSMEQEAARWGVESWALALGISVGQTSTTPRTETTTKKSSARSRKSVSPVDTPPRAKTPAPTKAPAQKAADEVEASTPPPAKTPARKAADKAEVISEAEAKHRLEEEPLRKRSQSTTRAKKEISVSPSTAPKPSSPSSSDGKATPRKKSPDKVTIDEAEVERQVARFKAEQAEDDRRRAEATRIAREKAERERREKAEEERQRKAREEQARKSFEAEVRRRNEEELRRIKQPQPTTEAKKELPVSPPQAPKPGPPQPSSGGQVTTPSSTAQATTPSDYWQKQFGRDILAMILSLILNTVIFVWLANQFYTIPQVFSGPITYDAADALLPKRNIDVRIPGLFIYFILPCLVGVVAVIISKRAERRDGKIRKGYAGLGCVSGLLFPVLIVIGLWGASSGLLGALVHIRSNNWGPLIIYFGFISCVAAAIYGAAIEQRTKKS